MAKYNSFAYGEAKYGPVQPTGNLAWTFTVAWDGYYGWGNEGLRLVDLTVRRGRRAFVRSGRLEPFSSGEAIGIFDNEDGRLDPWNHSSPLYPHVSPGRFVRIAALDLDTDTNYEIMRGVIRDIRPMERNGKRFAEIHVVDGLSWLKGKLVDTYIVADDAVYTLAEQVRNDHNSQWPNSEWIQGTRVQKTGLAADTKAYWWVWRDDAVEALHDIEKSEIAVTFHDREGYFTWLDRDYVYYRTYTLKEEDVLREISVQQPWDYIVNDITFYVNAKEAGTPASTIWQMNSAVDLDAGDSKDFWTLFTYENKPCAAGSLGFSITANTQADGGGADISGDISSELLITEPATGAHEYSAGCGIRLTNDGISDGYITAFSITGTPYYVPSRTAVRASDETSVALYGGKSLEIDGKWAEDYDDAQAIADWLLANLKDPTPYPVIQLEDQPEGQFYLDLYDRLRFVARTVGIADVYRIGAIEHRTIGDNCQAVRTTFWTEPYMIFPIDTSDDAFHAAELTKSAAQTIPNTTITNVTWDVETIDTDGFHSGSSEQIVIPTSLDGFYFVEVDLEWEGFALGTVRWAKLYLNGTIVAEATSGPIGATDMNQHLIVTRECAAGDYFLVKVYQDGGGGLDIDQDTVISTPRFNITFMGA